MILSMYYYVYNHQHKGQPYHRAMKAAGHTANLRKADVTLFDRDQVMNSTQPCYQVTEQLERGSLIMIYPHSALPPWWYDGLVPVRDYLSCVFVIGEAHKAATSVFMPGARVEVAGWPWCAQKPFKAPKQVKRVLFAPIHLAGGLRPEAYEANRNIFRELKRIKRNENVEIVIRYIGELQEQGLKPYREFEFVEGFRDGATGEIDRADVVIAEGTFMYLAVARGVPTIGINQHLPTRANKNYARYTPHTWNDYGHLFSYPINYKPGQLRKLIEQAAAGEQSEWRAANIGKTMDPLAFAETVEGIWREKQKY